MSRRLGALVLLFTAAPAFACEDGAKPAATEQLRGPGEPAPDERARAQEEGERRILYWVAPMDPSYRSDRPGKSPMGMDLVPVYADEAAPQTNVVEISPTVVQNMGVRTEPVRRGDLSRRVRTVGSVVVAEDELAVVNLRYSGWVEQIYVDQTGVPVSVGQKLFSIYSPELVAAQQEYLIALRAGAGNSRLVRSVRRRLALLGLTAEQIQRIARTGRVERTLTVHAPRDGYVIEKNVVEGARVEAGKDAYRIAGLSSVWIEAEVYEFHAPFIEEGAPATVELTFQPGREYQARVSYIYPTLDERTRTLRVRLEMPNPGLGLRPGNFATVAIQSRRREGVLVVPTESIIKSGMREIVFVAKGNGRFEAREITTGLVGDASATEVVSGLEQGEIVVTSGQFLLDSESQLQEAMLKLEEPMPTEREPAAAGAGEPARGEGAAPPDRAAPARPSARPDAGVPEHEHHEHGAS